MRALVRLAGGSWTSATAGTVVVSRASTALCVIASLRSVTNPVDVTKLFGTVNDTTFNEAGTGISQAEFTSVLNLVTWAVGADQDPVAAVSLNTKDNTYFRVAVPHGVAAVSPAGTLTQGTVVTIHGSGFSATPGENIVLFQGSAGSVIASPAGPSDVAVDRSWIRVTAPAGITPSGQIYVQVGGIIAAGPGFGPSLSIVRDGSVDAGVDQVVQYSPVAAGQGLIKSNWNPMVNAIAYKLAVGTTPGGSDTFAYQDVGNVTKYTASGLTLGQGGRYFVSIMPVYAWGDGSVYSSDGLRVAEAYSWDGASEFGKDNLGNPIALRNVADGGYVKDFPAGNGWISVYGNHSFEIVDIPAGTTVRVAPFGKVDSIDENSSMSDLKVSQPRDGWLAIYANTIRVAGTIDADGRGYGGGGGGTGSNAGAYGHGGKNGLAGNGGSWLTALGGLGYGGGGGGGSANGCPGTFNGGNGGPKGGGGGGAYGAGNNAGSDGSGGSGSQGGGQLPYNGGPPGIADNQPGGGGAGYGAGGGGAVPGCGPEPAGGGGGGGTGGRAAVGLGWSGGTNTGAIDGRGGRAGKYGALPAGSDLSFRLGSGGAGGNGWDGGEKVGGGGGGAGGGSILLVSSGDLAISGKLTATGAAGGGAAGNNGGGAGGGGGGSGGTIIVSGQTVSLTGTLSARGGDDGGDRAGEAGGGGGRGANNASISGGVIKVLSMTFSGSMPGSDTALKIFTATP